MNCKRNFFVLACLSIGLSAHAALPAAPQDSVGAERKGKNTLVLHKIASGETLFSIARRYQASVADIKNKNPGLGDALKLGAIVKVPYNAAKAPAKNSLPAGQAGIPGNGQTHTVANGESLFNIARKYRMSVASLKQLNNLESEELQVGQQLAVGGGKARNPVSEARPKNSIPGNGQTHTVANGEGLYSIARKYKVSVGDLKKWNGMTGESLDIGQELAISAPKAASPVLAMASEPKPVAGKTIEKPVETPTPVREMPVAVGEAKPAPAKPILAETAAPNPNGPDSIGNKAETKPERTPLIVNNSGYVKTVESGLAEAITDAGSSDLFLALHRTAPVGTIMQVRNEMNDQSVFVKVIGSLPDTGDNDKVVVKISRRAYERLAAVDKRFRVQVSYMPQ